MPATNRPKSPRKPVPAQSPLASQSARSGYNTNMQSNRPSATTLSQRQGVQPGAT
jgi:hypothetical protein